MNNRSITSLAVVLLGSVTGLALTASCASNTQEPESPTSAPEPAEAPAEERTQDDSNGELSDSAEPTKAAGAAATKEQPPAAPTQLAPKKRARSEVSEQMLARDPFEEATAKLNVALASVDCPSAAKHRDQICAIADQICEISKDLPQSSDAKNRCSDGTLRCRSAKKRVSAKCD